MKTQDVEESTTPIHVRLFGIDRTFEATATRTPKDVLRRTYPTDVSPVQRLELIEVGFSLEQATSFMDYWNHYVDDPIFQAVIFVEEVNVFLVLEYNNLDYFASNPDEGGLYWLSAEIPSLWEQMENPIVDGDDIKPVR